MHTRCASIHMKESGIGSHKIIRRKRDGELEYLPDDLTIEEPLEIRVGRKPIATTMRTPGHDEELAAGFLLSEGIVRDRDQIVSVSMGGGDNRVVVELTDDVKLKLNSTKRFGTISSSCGLCGKTSIDAIRQNFPAIRSAGVRIDIETLLSLPEILRDAQSDFARTGGIHAAGICEEHLYVSSVSAVVALPASKSADSCGEPYDRACGAMGTKSPKYHCRQCVFTGNHSQ